MLFKKYFLFLRVFVLANTICHAQAPDSLKRISGYICNETSDPLFCSHVINVSNGRGSTSDTNGKFTINAGITDSILFRNLAYHDLIISAGDFREGDTIHMLIKLYAIKEVKIFEWGSTYADFKAKVKSMPVTENMGEKLGLPQQTGNPIPNYRNPDVLSNPLFAYTNPVDFLYFNLNKKERSIRKVMEFKQNEDLIRKFESVYNRVGIGALTGLANEELDKFMIYLNLHFKCDFNCTEIQIVSEIYMHWKNYREGKE
jgi:hypothetical protein